MHTNLSLFARIAEGDEAAFTEIVDTYSASIQKYISGIVDNEETSQEITQDVFLKIWLKREQLTTVKNSKAWLYKMAFNASVSHIRSVANKACLVDEWHGHVQKHEPSVDHMLDAKQLQEIIQQGVIALSPRRRIIYQLSHERHLSRKEIAKEMEISENAVRNGLSEAHKFLQEYILKHADVYIPVFLIIFFTPYVH